MTKTEKLVATFRRWAEGYDKGAVEHHDEFYQGKAEAYNTAAKMLKAALQEDKDDQGQG